MERRAKTGSLPDRPDLRARARSPSRDEAGEARANDVGLARSDACAGQKAFRTRPHVVRLATALVVLLTGSGPAAWAGSDAIPPARTSRSLPSNSRSSETVALATVPSPARSTLTEPPLPNAGSLQSLEIREIGPPLPYPAPIWPWLVVAATLCGTAATLTWWYRRRQLTQAALLSLNNSAAEPLWQQALIRIDQLMESGLLERGRLESFHVELANVLRWYLDKRFPWAGRARTSNELVDAATYDGELPAEAVRVLKEVLERCDMVKFAQDRPSSQEVLRTVELCRRVVFMTRQQTLKEDLPQADRMQEASGSETVEAGMPT